MIIVRSPLRISIGGGGTDIPSYYKEKESFFISAAINKYIYITVTEPFEDGIYLKYSKIEKTKNTSKIHHKIIKKVLEQELKKNKIEITSLTDIPAKTGLGSSGSFTTALIKAIYCFNQKMIGRRELAEKACKIEIEKLKLPSGKQDQYISVYGGLSEFNIDRNGYVKVNSLKIKKETLLDLEDNLLLFFTGFSRNSSSILAEQNKRTLRNDREMIENLDYVKSLGYEIKKNLLKGNCDEVGNIFNKHWNYKLKRSKNMTNKIINEIYNYALKNGAKGGKLIGAGGGGFLLFYTNKPNQLRKSLIKKNLTEVRFKFDFEGVKQVL